MTAYAETDAGIVYPRSSNGHAVTELDRSYAFMTELYESRIRQLELELDEQGWTRIDSGATNEFTRDGLRKIIERARLHYLKNPLVKRAVEVGALYVWGQDLTVNAADEDVQAVIDRFWALNQTTLTGQQASRLMEVELQVTGNVFLALFPDPSSGTVRVRGIPVEEIAEIVCNPEDRAEVWFYRREWNERPLDGGQAIVRKALYPDWRYAPANKPESVGELEVRWTSPVVHVKAGAFPHWRWGVPEVYAALDWARAYKEQLEDDATRSRALAKFAWRLTTQGGRTAVEQAKTRLNTTLGTTTGETNPPPGAGATLVGDKSFGFDPIRIAGTMLDPEHSRPARLMASAALGIPDHFFDADVGNFATSKTLDRPTELRFTERRQMWKDVLTELCLWVIDRDLEAVGGLLRSVSEEQRDVELSWPSLLEREAKDVVLAIREAATLNGQKLAGTIPRETTARLMMVAVGVEDIDGELAKLELEWAEQDQRRDEMAQRLSQPSKEEPGEEDPERDEEREAFVAALREVREALGANAG